MVAGRQALARSLAVDLQILRDTMLPTHPSNPLPPQSPQIVNVRRYDPICTLKLYAGDYSDGRSPGSMRCCR